MSQTPGISKDDLKGERGQRGVAIVPGSSMQSHFCFSSFPRRSFGRCFL